MIESVTGPPLLNIVQLHVEEAAMLRRQRTRLARAAHIRIHLLARHDQRIEAHLDGIAVAGAAGRELAYAAAVQLGGAEVFTAVSVALVENDHLATVRLLDAAQSSADALRGFVSALGWASAGDLRGISATLLASHNADARALGLAACAMHHVDPATILADALFDSHEPLATRALNVAACLGRVDLREACSDRMGDTNASVALRNHAACASLLLGDRRRGLAFLNELPLHPVADPMAHELVLLSLDPEPCRARLQRMAGQDADAMRALVRGAGLSGLTRYLPWLIERCADAKLARLAADSFCLITGIDLESESVVAATHASEESLSNDAAAAADLALNPDEDRPWPDVKKLAAWWQANRPRFEAPGRWFAGAPLTSEQCLKVLRYGAQPHRALAALHRTLLVPGTPLFNTVAPAWRQQRLLAKMSA